MIFSPKLKHFDNISKSISEILTVLPLVIALTLPYVRYATDVNVSSFAYENKHTTHSILSLFRNWYRANILFNPVFKHL
jgi:hypothetical protein